uniref:protein ACCUMULATION AND REPLICATION OF CHLOROPLASTS 3 isoform X2 n=1 Tax=Erigeron canadensis TaxID=72917 RepID=UPI001CB9B780|nr:protein ACCUMULATION AND REPLICATION OF CHLOROPLASTS 3 isoform X2 [Erigeron canadensis]
MKLRRYNYSNGYLGMILPEQLWKIRRPWNHVQKRLYLFVAGASYGSDLTTVHDIFEAIKLANGFVVMIILKPFRFEGQRRQNEVKDLLNKLKGLTDFCIMVDADALLEKDLVTLDEALQIANNAVLMALNAVSILTSEHNKRFLDIPHESMKELAVTDLKKILGSFKDAKIGYGVGRDVETSVAKAIYDCPFLGSGVKDLSGIVVFILASPTALDRSDLGGILLNFRQVAKWQGDVIISVVHESDVTPGSIATTIFTIGCTRPESSKQDGIFSRLVQRFPFIFNILSPRSQLDTFKENRLDSTFSSQGMKSESFENPDGISTNGLAEGFHNWSSELQSILRNATYEKTPSSVDDVAEQINAEFPQATLYNESTGGSPTLQRELLINRRPGNLISEETANDINDSLLVDLKTYKLPVGVKPSGDLKDGPNGSRIMHSLEGNGELKSKKETQFSVNISFDKSTDASSQAPTGFNSNASSHQNGVYPDVSNKSGRLSARAASMLESERESQKKWSPVVEINYRGGLYVGRCQGGLPEGKGRLSLGDGSFYDGLWRNGKRSGLGTFCFSNGDVFRGSWRDDVMHGKGWFYFHTGDRWFVNFWKGKANGEGRFYSTTGEIFFGHFKNGWRDGHFLCIDVSGLRCVEIWDEGVLVSRKQMESDDGAG